MINKKRLWFLTLFSLILVLSIYYITMPSELLLSTNKINLEEGFNLRGIITHERNKNSGHYGSARLLRGLYIDNNLFTISENKIKVNNLDTLESVSELEIIKKIEQTTVTPVVEQKTVIVD